MIRNREPSIIVAHCEIGLTGATHCVSVLMKMWRLLATLSGTLRNSTPIHYVCKLLQSEQWQYNQWLIHDTSLWLLVCQSGKKPCFNFDGCLYARFFFPFLWPSLLKVQNQPISAFVNFYCNYICTAALLNQQIYLYLN